MLRLYRSLHIMCAAALLPLTASAADKNELHVYSAQQEHLIRPVLDLFEEETNIKVRVITGKAPALVSRLKLEGERSPADILLTVDIGNIVKAEEEALLQPISSELLQQRIPEHLRDKQGFWYGFSVRARAIFYNKDNISPGVITSYSDLADPAWNKQLLIRSSTNMYNQSLVASILAHSSKKETSAWLKGVVANMARRPQGGDTDQLRALAAGEGNIAVANTYYYGRLLAGDPDIRDSRVAEKVGIIFPNQSGKGTHINIRGGGVTAHSDNVDGAVRLLEFLTSEPAQRMFAEYNFEYPVVAGVKIPDVLAAWGTFKQDALSLHTVGALNREAVELMDDAGWQ